jgi:predicted esterase
MPPSTPHGGAPVVMEGKPLGQGRVVVIMVHGRGAGPKNILEIAPALQLTDATWLAPAASQGTWYPQSFLAPIEQNEPGITSGIAVVHGLIDEAIAAGVPSERIVLLGFSQGACLASTAAQRRPARYGAVLVFSGGLIGPPGTVWSERGSFDGTPVFLGCSDVDGHIPATRVRETAAVFERMGAAVTMKLYPGMGHLVSEDELAVAREILISALGS